MIDRATVIGLLGLGGLLAWTLIAGAGSSVGVFWRTPALALVIGGSVLATLIAYPAERFLGLRKVLGKALFVRTRPMGETVAMLVALAALARREGLLALDRRLERINDVFLKSAMRMVVDGADPGTIKSVMRTHLESMDLRHAQSKGMLESMGRVAPVLGMIGTVIGLVIMLGRMDDPSRIGPGMAVALLTTLYGLLFANLFCWPLARKLEHRSSDELLRKTLVLEGGIAIQQGDHPRMVEQKLRAFLPESGLDGAIPVRWGPGRKTEPSAEPVAEALAERTDRPQGELVEAA